MPGKGSSGANSSFNPERNRTIAKFFDSQCLPRDCGAPSVEFVDSRLRGNDGLGADSTVWQDFAIVLQRERRFGSDRLV